jgi:hypothetical protein
MDKLNGELHWPKSEREVEPLSDRGIKEFLVRCDWREQREKKVVTKGPKRAAQCVLVSDRTVRNPTIKDTTHDEPGEDARVRLGHSEAGQCAGATGGEERPVAGDYDGDADE